MIRQRLFLMSLCESVRLAEAVHNAESVRTIDGPTPEGLQA
jgi:hypothetical protein